MGNTNNTQNPNNNANNNGQNNPQNPNNNSGGFFSRFLKKTNPEPEEEDDWGNFINQQQDNRDRIYSNVRTELKSFDPEKEAKKMEIVKKKMTKTTVKYWLKDESLPSTYINKGKNVDISIKVDVKCKTPSSLNEAPTILSVFLFAKETQDAKTNKFLGVQNSKFHGSFAHFNHGKIKTKTTTISPNGKYFVFKKKFI
jgi:hypothetical protein